MCVFTIPMVKVLSRVRRDSGWSMRRGAGVAPVYSTKEEKSTDVFKITTAEFPLAMTIMTDFMLSAKREIGMAAFAAICGWFQWRLAAVVTQESDQRCIDHGVVTVIRQKVDVGIAATVIRQ